MTNHALRVFVSSKMEELAAEREAVREGLARLLVKAFVFERDAGARPGTIQETYREEIEAADLYIGIFWKGYGTYTIDEYEHAQTLGMDCLIYEKHDEGQTTRDPELAAFLERVGGVSRGVTARWFRTADELRRFVAEDVAAWQARIVHERAAPAAPAVYAGVPPMVDHFVGRAPVLIRMAARLRAGENLAVEGLPGVGKTTLAVALTRHPGVRRHFRDGVLWASLGPAADVTTALLRWTEALEIDVTAEATDAGRAQRVRDAIGTRRMLLVLDDLWDAAPAKLLRCGGPGCAHLLTTRDKAIARGFAGSASASELGTLDDDRAGELLRALAPEAWDADPDGARGLLAAVGGLPLAIGLIGGYLAAPERGLFGDVFGDLSEQAFAELVDPRTRLALAERRLGAARAEPTTLEETILLSLEGLPDPVRRAFFALGAFEPMPARFSREAAEAVTGASGRVLALLAARHLLQVEQEGRQLTLHRTVSDAARTRPDPGAAARHRAHYFGLVASGRNRHDKWLVADHYPQLARAWASASDDEWLLDALALMRHFFSLRNASGEYLAWAERALAVAERHGLTGDRGAVLANMSCAHFRREDYPRALALTRDALPLLEAAGNRRGHGRACHNLATCHHALGDNKAALEWLHRAVTMLEVCGAAADLTAVFNTLALVHIEAGDQLRAEVFRQQSRLSRPEPAGQEPSRTEVDFTLPASALFLRQQPFFLVTLDAIVRGAEETAEFDGSLVVGVRLEKDQAVKLWHARFEKGKRPETAFVDQVPSDARAVLLLGERQADAMLSTGAFPAQPGQLVGAGDRSLMEKFLAQFLRERLASVEPADQVAAKSYAAGLVLDSAGHGALAMENLDRAAQLQTAVVEGGRRDLVPALAASLHARGRVLGRLRRFDEALRDFDRAIEMRSALVEREGRGDLAGELASSLSRRGVILAASSRASEAVTSLTTAIRLRGDAGTPDATRALAEDHAHRALACRVAGDRGGAAEDHGRVIELLTALGDEAAGADRELLVRACRGRARMLAELGRHAEAIRDFDRAIELGRRDMQDSRGGAAADLAADLTGRASAHQRRSDVEPAVTDLRAAIELYRELVEGEGRDDLATSLADACFECGLYLAMVGRTAEARGPLDEAVERLTRLASEGGAVVRRRLARAHHVRALAPEASAEEALASFDRAIAIYTEVAAESGEPAVAADLAECHGHRATRLLDAARFADAVAGRERALAVYTELLPTLPDRAASGMIACLNDLAWIRATCPDPAVRDGRRAVEAATRMCELAGGGDHRAFDTLAAAYAEAGDFDAAVEWQRKALERADESEWADFRARLDLYRARTPHRDA